MRTKKICTVCREPFVAFNSLAKYCSPLCKGRAKNHEKICRYCKKNFMGHKQQKCCSMYCVGFEQKERLVKGNIGRRKYEKISGMTRQQLFRYNNPEKKLLEYNRERLKRLEVVNHLGAKCIKCGYCDDIRALELDHKNNDGHLDRKKRGNKITRYYCNHLDEAEKILQVLCANCNKIKQIAEGEFCKSKVSVLSKLRK